jgi:N-methylhydantoinase B/oxoprolinase/acetone carboxylase alpha subunit
MSLTNPTKFEKAITFITTKSPRQRILVIAALALVVLAIVLFGADKFSAWNAKRKLNNAKAEVNVALKELANAKAVVDPHAEAAALEKLKEAANTAIASSVATDEAKAETNVALTSYKLAKNANVPTGTTEAALLKAMEGLE